MLLVDAPRTLLWLLIQVFAGGRAVVARVKPMSSIALKRTPGVSHMTMVLLLTHLISLTIWIKSTSKPLFSSLALVESHSQPFFRKNISRVTRSVFTLGAI